MNKIEIYRKEQRRYARVAGRWKLMADNTTDIEKKFAYQDLQFHYGIKAMAAQALMQMEIGLI